MKLSDINANMKVEKEEKVFEPLAPGRYVFTVTDVKPTKPNQYGNVGECITLKVIGGERRGALVFFNVFTQHSIRWLVSTTQKLLAELVECCDKPGITDTSSLVNVTVTGDVINRIGKNDGKVWASISKFHPVKKENQMTIEVDNDSDIPF